MQFVIRADRTFIDRYFTVSVTEVRNPAVFAALHDRGVNPDDRSVAVAQKVTHAC